MKTFRIKENNYLIQKNDIYKLANNDRTNNNRKIYNKIQTSIDFLITKLELLIENQFINGQLLYFLIDMRDIPNDRVDIFINKNIAYLENLSKDIAVNIQEFTSDYNLITYEFYIEIITNMAKILFELKSIV